MDSVSECVGLRKHNYVHVDMNIVKFHHGPWFSNSIWHM